jgi:quinol-cytochrome oxidoreductase complex cytochrome b subunit
MANNITVIKLTDKERKKLPRKFFLLHLRPPTVPEKTLQFSLTWGLGGMAAMLVGMQFATGILLNFVFEPTPSGAYASIIALQNDTPFGQLVRNIHHWSANLLVLIVFLHAMRVFFYRCLSRTPSIQLDYRLADVWNHPAGQLNRVSAAL